LYLSRFRSIGVECGKGNEERVEIATD